MDDLTQKELKKRLRLVKRDLRDLEARRHVVVEEADSGDFDPSVMNATHRLLLTRIRECHAEIDRIGKALEVLRADARIRKESVVNRSSLRKWLLSPGNAVGAAILIVACLLLIRACRQPDIASNLNITITSPNYNPATDQVEFSLQNRGDLQGQVFVPLSRTADSGGLPVVGVCLDVRQSNGEWLTVEGTEGAWICRGEKPLDTHILDMYPGRNVPMMLDIGQLKSMVARPDEVRLRLQSLRGHKLAEHAIQIPKPSQTREK